MYKKVFKKKVHCADGTFLFGYRQLLAPGTLISFDPSVVHSSIAVYLIADLNLMAG